jgi:hypothetical protein
MQLSQIEETLLALAGIKKQLEQCLRTFKRHKQDQEAKACLANYLLILVASFDQEWQRLEGLGTLDDVRRTLIAAGPATRRIRAWRGLHRARSSLLAHGFRDKDGNLVNASALFGPRLLPTGFAGQLLLGELSVYAIATAIYRHKLSLDAGLQKLDSVWHNAEPPATGIMTMGAFEAEIASVRTEILALEPELENCFRVAD